MMLSIAYMKIGGKQSGKKATVGSNGYDSKGVDVIMAELSNCSVSAEKKAQNIVKLLESGYILVHKILNEGENYNDKKQQESFKKYLNKERVAKLQRVGRDE